MEDVILQSPACQECLTTFQNNALKAFSLIQIPAWTSLISGKYAEACTRAENEVFEAHSGHGITKATPEKKMEYIVRVQKLMTEIIQRDAPNRSIELEYSTRMIEPIVIFSGLQAHWMFENILKSMCIQFWTAMEVLLEDLFMKVIEYHPHSFSHEVRAKHARTKTHVKGKGTRFGFRSRDKFSDAYNVAFSCDDTIMNVINSEGVSRLAVVRNLIVHKAGIADGKFMDTDLGQIPSLNIFRFIREVGAGIRCQ
jgi:hypothetical protein